MPDGGFLVIQKWMLTKLNLKSTELLVYAIIYGFSQDGQGECWASLDYFLLWTGASRASVIRAINSLEEKGLIKRRKRVGTTSALSVVLEKTNRSKGSVKMTQGGVKMRRGGVKMIPNNKEDNKTNSKEIKKESDEVAVEVQRTYDLFIEKFDKNPNTFKLTPKRQKKIKARLKDCGETMLRKAIENTAKNEFYRGKNDRGWKADLDFIIRSYEQVERLANIEVVQEERELDYWDKHII